MLDWIRVPALVALASVSHVIEDGPIVPCSTGGDRTVRVDVAINNLISGPPFVRFIAQLHAASLG